MSTTRRIGQYEIRELLGEGGIGQVYAAHDTEIGRDVAIKSLKPELLSDSTFAERFRAEGKNLGKLTHPNITTLYSLLSEGRNLYMVMELVRGRTLDAILQERGAPFSISEALAIIGQAAEGLSYAHGLGIIHRDIKPANLIITDNGLLKIMDFGIARVQGSQHLTRDGSIMGTLAYMAPEQLRAEEVDARTDLYSLAVVLYEMLCGSVPFTAASEYDLMRAQIHTAPERITHRVPGIGPQIERALMRALSKKPADRYPSMAAFKDALGATGSRSDAMSVVQKATRLISVASLPDSVRSTVSAISAPVVAAMSAPPRKSAIPLAVRGIAIGAAAAIVVAGAIVLMRGNQPKRQTASSTPPATVVAPSPAQAAPAVKTSSTPTTACNSYFPGNCQSAPSAGPPAPGSSTSGPSPRPEGGGARPPIAVEPETPRPAAHASQAVAVLNIERTLPAASDIQRAPPVVPPDIQRVPEQRGPTQSAIPADNQGSAPEPRMAAPTQLPATSNPEPAAASQPSDATAPANPPLSALPSPSGDPRRPTVADAKAAFDLKDYARARELAETLAAGGDPECQFIMGRTYEIGGATRRDLEKAAEWYQKAAEKGHPKAQFNLGVFYETGEGGVLPSKRTAAELYHKAAMRGHAGAQLALAEFFLKGEGVDRDASQARRWFTEAANSPDPDVSDQARTALSRLGRRGR